MIATRIERVFRAVAGFAIARAWVVVVLSVLASAFAVRYTVDNLGVNTDTGYLFSDRLEWRRTYLDLAHSFPMYSDNLILVLEAGTPETAEMAAARLASALGRRDDLLQWVYRPGAGEFFARARLLYLDTADLRELGENLTAIQPFLGSLASTPTLTELFDITARAVDGSDRIDESRLEAVLSRLDRAVSATLSGEHAPLSWRAIIADRAATRSDRRQLIIVKPKLDFDQLLPTTAVVRALHREAESIGIDSAHGMRLRVTGDVAMANDELESVSRGAVTGALAAVVMVALILLVGLRSVRLTVASVVTLLVGLTFTAAFAALAVGHLNLISVAFGVLYIGLGIDFAIHVCLEYRALMVRGLAHRDALVEATGKVGGTLFVCALTTGIGFFAFLGTDFVGVSELGLISGSGMFISLGASVVLLPALLTLSHLRRVGPSRPGDRVGRPDLPERYPRVVVAIAVVLAVASLSVVPRAKFDRNPINLREASSESVSTFLELLAESDRPPWPIVVLADPARVADIERRLASLPEVDSTISIADFVPADQPAKLALVDDLVLTLGLVSGAPSAPATPDGADVGAALARLRKAVAARLDAATTAPAVLTSLAATLESLDRRIRDGAAEPGLLALLEQNLLETLVHELAGLSASLDAVPVTMQDLPPELLDRWVSPDGRHRIEVFPSENIQDPAALRRFVEAVRSVEPAATDSPVTMFESGNVVVASFQEALAAAVVLIALILLVLLRSVRDLLLVLAPLLLAASLTVAAMVVLGIAFNFANVITLPLLLGVGVDNGIHIVRRARSETGAGSVLHTSTARAVVVSALTTVASFGNLAFSAHPGTASMGQVLTVGLALNLVCTLYVLPALLAWERSRGRGDRSAPRLT